MATKRPKNILFIWTDQQRPDTIGAYGNPDVDTPHLDRLLEQSSCFDQAYCSQPVCAPARATALTGLYPHTHGVVSNGIPLDADIPAIAELLQPAGLVSGHIGMWHLAHKAQPLRPQRGFERFWVSTEDQYTASHAAEGYSSYHDFLLSQGYTPADPHGDGTIFARATTTRLPEEVSKPAFEAAEAIRFLETYGDDPFLLVVGIHEPHPPCYSPFDDYYRPEDMTLPESWYLPLDPHAARHCHTVRRIYAEEGFKDIDSNDERGWKEAKARYWGLCRLVDRSVGKVLQRLDELGLADDTIVVYTADHGHLLGEHRMWNKGVPYEPSVQVPLLLRVPGLPPRRITTPVSLVRLMPTLLELMGLPIPAHIQGTSLVPLLTGGDAAPDEEAVFIEWNGPWKGGGVYSDVAVRTIRQGRWKLNVSANGDCELYDLQDDPEELRNAIVDRGRAQTVGRLFDRLRAWQQETDDPVVLPHPLEHR